MRKKKICFIVSTPYTAKAFLENHFENLSNDFEVSLIANLDEDGLEEYNHESLKFVKNIEIVRKISVFKDIKALFNTTSYLRKNQFDIIICFTPKAGLIGITAAKIAGVKNRIHFFTGQVWHTKKGLFKDFLKLLDKIVVKLSTNIIVDGIPQQNYLIENKIITKDNSITLGKGTISGIDTLKFSPNKQMRETFRVDNNISPDDFVFLFLGRLNVDKGILDLVEAFFELEKTNNTIKLLVVGPDEEDIVERIKNSEWYSENIIFYGKTNKPEFIYPVADVFCLPSHREAFGLSIIEASSCKLPIICSDTYGLKDSIINNLTGINHVTGDVKSLRDAMQYMLLNESKRNSFSSEGRKYILDNFSKELITDIWKNYLKKL